MLASLALATNMILVPSVTNAEVVEEDKSQLLQGSYVSDELIIKYDKLDEKSLQKKGYKLLKVLNDDYALVQTSANNLSSAMQQVEDINGVVSVQPNYIYTASDLPNDPYNNQLWGLHNTGQTIQYTKGIEDIDINLPETLNRIGEAELEEVVVAVIDTGVDIYHPDLADNIWVNEKELKGVPGKDDDGNGYVDDIHGYDFHNNDNSVYDNPYDDEHGTHVAGTIAAATNNNIGITGIAPNVKIMSLKFLGDNGRGSTESAILAIEYAKKMGVKISNNSWGGPLPDEALQSTIENSGMLFIAAAGNDSLNIDKGGAYPAAFNSPNILSVTAINNRGEHAYFSNYGTVNTDIAAPGVAIYSTTPENSYGYLDGTSMAAPHVTGVAALAMGYNNSLKDLKPAEFIKIIKDTGTTVVGAKNTSSKKMLNAFNLISAVTPLTASSINTVYDTSKFVSGSTVPNSTVTIKAGSIVLGTQKSDAMGNFKIKLNSKQAKNTVLTISIKNGTKTHNITTTVLSDDVKPQLISNLRVTNADTQITGIVDEDAKVSLTMAGRTLTTQTDDSGKFTFRTGTLLLGQEGTLVIEDTAVPANKTEIAINVIDGIKPVLKKISTIYNSSYQLSGEVSEPSTIKFYFSSYMGGYYSEPEVVLEIDKAGPFSVTFDSQPFGYLRNANVKIVLEDAAGNLSDEKIVKVQEDKTKPKLLSPTKLELDDRGETVMNLQFDEQVSLYIYVNGNYEDWMRSSIDGKVQLNLPKLNKNDTVVIDYYDYNWNTGTIKSTVLDKTNPVIETVSSIYNTSKAVSGVVSEKSTVTATTTTNGKKTTVGTAKTDVNGNFTMTFKKTIATGTIVELTAVDEAKPKSLISEVKSVEVLADTIKPQVLSVNASDASTTLDGQLTEEATIELYKVTNDQVETKVLAKGKTDATGKFKLNIGKQKEGTVIQYVLKDTATPANVTTGQWIIQDKTVPVLKTFGSITNTSTVFTGDVNEAGTIKVYRYVNKKITGSPILTQSINEAGKFNFSANQLYFKGLVNNEVAVIAIDHAGNESKVKVVKVTADKAAPKLLSPSKIALDDTGVTVIEGTLSEKGSVKVVVAGNQIASTNAGFDGAFKLTIPKQKPNTKVDIIFTDENGNTSKQTVTVVDKTNPIIMSVNDVNESQKYIAGVLSEKGTITATAVVNNKKTTVGTVKTDAEGNFKLVLKKPLDQGVEVSLTAKDDKGLVTLNPYTITIEKDEIAPVVNFTKVNDAVNAIEGSISEEASIYVTYTNKKNTTVISRTVNTDIYGAFKNLSIKDVAIGSEMTITVTDKKGFITESIVYALDSTPPVISKISKLTITSKNLTGNVSEAATVQLFKVVNGKVTTAPIDATILNKAGSFKFDLSVHSLIEGQTFAIRAIDARGNVSLDYEILVLRK